MILIMGMPGAGKSVQSSLLQQRLGLHWTSTGQIFRDSKDPEFLKIMQTGALVDDSIVCRLVGERLKAVSEDTTTLLDGFPRTLGQVEWLLSHLEEISKQINLVLYLVVDQDTALARLGDRKREDDSTEAIAKREEEAAKMEPVLEHLREAGITIVDIDANGSVEDVFELIEAAIDEHTS